MDKIEALDYVQNHCTKMGLCENLSTFYVKCPPEGCWDYKLMKKIFKYEPRLQIKNIYQAWMENDYFVSESLNLIYEHGCEIVENEYIDNNFNFKITNNLIELLKEYFHSIPDEYQMGSSLEDKIVQELDKIKSESVGI